MKVKYFQKWTDVIYCKTDIKKFKHWSNLVLGRGDAKLKSRILAGASVCHGPMLGFWNWIKKNWGWKKYIILDPGCNPEARFRMGFYSEKFGTCKLSSAVRKISDGLFAMRMGPDDCYFFVVGDGEITLKIAGYAKDDCYFFVVGDGEITLKIAGYAKKDIWLY